MAAELECSEPLSVPICSLGSRADRLMFAEYDSASLAFWAMKLLNKRSFVEAHVCILSKHEQNYPGQLLSACTVLE